MLKFVNNYLNTHRNGNSSYSFAHAPANTDDDKVSVEFSQNLPFVERVLSVSKYYSLSKEKRWKFMGEWVFKYLIKKCASGYKYVHPHQHNIDEDFTFDLSVKF